MIKNIVGVDNKRSCKSGCATTFYCLILCPLSKQVLLFYVKPHNTNGSRNVIVQSCINITSNKINLIFFFKPVDLLPFRIQDVRRQLESEGDLTIEALTLLRTAEDERRGKK